MFVVPEEDFTEYPEMAAAIPGAVDQ